MNGLEKGTLDVLRRSAREIVRLANARKVTLKSPKRDSGELNALSKFLSIFGAPPNDASWSFAARIAECLGQSLSAEQAMNEFHCGEFIRLNKAKFFENAPSLKQIELAKNLASLKAIPLPRKCELHLSEWEAFMKANILRDDIILIEDYLEAMNLPRETVDFSNYGQVVYHLRRAKSFWDHPVSRKHLILERMVEMLKNRIPPVEVAENFDVEPDVTYMLSDKLEGSGHDIVWDS